MLGESLWGVRGGKGEGREEGKERERERESNVKGENVSSWQVQLKRWSSQVMRRVDKTYPTRSGQLAVNN